jgi:hypothetical protein
MSLSENSKEGNNNNVHVSKLEFEKKKSTKFSVSIFIFCILFGITGGALQYIINDEMETGKYPYFLSSGDLNNDGYSDLIVLSYRETKLVTTLSIHINDNGHLEEFKKYTVPFNSRHFTLTDFNNDSFLDIALANYAFNQVILYENDGTGRIEEVQTMDTIGNPSHIVSSDVDLDGLDDLLISSDSIPALEVKINTFDKDTVQFRSNQTFSVFSNNAFACIDVNSDTYPDLMVASKISDRVSIYLNDAGNFSFAKEISVDTKRITSFVADDLDNDGLADFACNGFEIYRNTGDLNFTREFSEKVGHIGQLIAVDLNNDGMKDIVSSLGVIFYNRGDWNFEPVREIATFIRSVTSGHFNDDNKVDLIGIYNENANEKNNEVIVITGKGDGRFTYAFELSSLYLSLVFTIIVIIGVAGICFIKEINRLQSIQGQISPAPGWDFKLTKKASAGLLVINLLMILIPAFLLFYVYIYYAYYYSARGPLMILPLMYAMLLVFSIFILVGQQERLDEVRSHHKKGEISPENLKTQLEKNLKNIDISYRNIYEDEMREKLLRYGDERKISKIKRSYRKKGKYYFNDHNFIIQFNFAHNSKTDEVYETLTIFNVNKNNISIVRNIEEALNKVYHIKPEKQVLENAGYFICPKCEQHIWVEPTEFPVSVKCKDCGFKARFSKSL